MFTLTNEAHRQAPTSRFTRLEANPKQISQRWLGFALRRLQKRLVVLQKWKQRRETDMAKEKWRERVKQQDIRQR